MAPIKRVPAIRDIRETTKSFRDVESRLKRQCILNDVLYLQPAEQESFLQTQTRRRELRAELGLKKDAK